MSKNSNHDISSKEGTNFYVNIRTNDSGYNRNMSSSSKSSRTIKLDSQPSLPRQINIHWDNNYTTNIQYQHNTTTKSKIIPIPIPKFQSYRLL